MYGNIIKCKCHHGLELNSATKQTKERKEIFLDFSKVRRKKKKEKIFLLFLQRKNQRRTGKNFEKIKTNNHKTDNTMEKGRRTLMASRPSLVTQSGRLRSRQQQI